MTHSASQSRRQSKALRLLITAGPTHEPIDAVRYIANRSSGRLGIALAEEAAARGLHVTLLLGPTHLDPHGHSHLQTTRFRTTADLQQLLREQWPSHDALIMAAAVADYRPAPQPASQYADGHPAQPLTASRSALTKISRSDQGLTLQLEATPDLLAELAAQSRPTQRVFGFALEPAERLHASARAKLARKKLEAIVANPLETMEAEDVPAGAVVIFKDGREVTLPGSSKRAFAGQLLDALALGEAR